MCTQYLNSIKTKMLLYKVGIDLTGKECFHLSNINTMANYLPFKGGAMATALYFKSKHSISYVKYTNLVIASQITQLLTISFVCFFLILIDCFRSNGFLISLFYFFWVLFVLVLLLIVIIQILVHREELFGIRLSKINIFIRDVSVILEDKKLLRRIFLINIAGIVVMGLRFFEAFKMLNCKAPPILSLLAGQIKTLAMLINITPSGLGVAEVSAGIISGITSNNINIGIYAATIDRIISIITLIFICLFYFGRKVRRCGIAR